MLRIIMSHETLVDDSFLLFRKVFPVNATMHLYMMSDFFPELDLYLASRLVTRFRTCRWTAFGLLHRLLCNSLGFVNCSLAVSVIFLLAIEGFLAGIALEVTQARFEEISGLVRTFRLSL